MRICPWKVSFSSTSPAPLLESENGASVQVSGGSGKSKLEAAQLEEDLDRLSETDEHAGDGDEPPVDEEENMEGDFTKFTGRKKKLWELRMKMNIARKGNETDIAVEKKRMEPPQESRGISKQKWLEERKRRIGKLLDANGLDMKSAYMLDT